MEDIGRNRSRIRWRRGTDPKPGILVVLDVGSAAALAVVLAVVAAGWGLGWFTAVWVVLVVVQAWQAVREVRLWRRARRAWGT